MAVFAKTANAHVALFHLVLVAGVLAHCSVHPIVAMVLRGRVLFVLAALTVLE